MKKILMAAAALAVAWPTIDTSARAESVIDCVLGGDKQQEVRDRQDAQRNQEQIDRAREQGRCEGHEDTNVRREHQELNGEDGRIDRDRRDLSGSSRDPHEGRRDEN